MAQDLLQANILELLGLTNLPRERQLSILNKLTDLVLRRVMLRIIEELPEEKKGEAEKILTSGSDEEKTEFIRNNTNFQKILEQETVAVKKELTDDIAQFEI